MLNGLDVTGTDQDGSQGGGELFEKGKPTVVMDAGIATEENIQWLIKHQYPYLVVSRKRHNEFSEDEAIIIKSDRDCTVKAHKVINEETGEVELYCHSSRREKKETAIRDRFSARFEEAIITLDAGLNKKGRVKKYDKVLVKIGRIKEKYSRVAKHYRIKVEKDEATDNAVKISWERKEASNNEDPNLGVYCLRTSQGSWDEKNLWRTYTMLTDLEAVFRSLKSELGLRPVFHQKTVRVSGHLFVTLLAYHLVHTIRYQLKKKGIHLSWSELRKQLSGQARITASVQCESEEIIHIRKSSRPEPRQQTVYDALNLPHHPGRRVKTVI